MIVFQIEFQCDQRKLVKLTFALEKKEYNFIGNIVKLQSVFIITKSIIQTDNQYMSNKIRGPKYDDP